ncbi:MAG: hypothetical protein AB1486_29180 [Planctomycetota bacterium]
MMKGCLCNILNAREEKLLDAEGRLIIRLICNTCGRVLDSEVLGKSASVQSRYEERAGGDAALEAS